MCAGGLKFEHIFTSKSAWLLEVLDSFPCLTLLDLPLMKTVKAKYNGFEPFGYGPRRNSYLEKGRLRGRHRHTFRLKTLRSNVFLFAKFKKAN